MVTGVGAQEFLAALKAQVPALGQGFP